jgi:hypothetical protein
MKPSFTSYSEPVTGSHNAVAGPMKNRTERMAMAVHLTEDGTDLLFLFKPTIGRDI